MYMTTCQCVYIVHDELEMVNMTAIKILFGNPIFCELQPT